MKAEEIKTSEDLERWYRTLSGDKRLEVARIAAYRDAMRALPYWSKWSSLSSDLEATRLPVFWAALILSARIRYPGSPFPTAVRHPSSTGSIAGFHAARAAANAYSKTNVIAEAATLAGEIVYHASRIDLTPKISTHAALTCAEGLSRAVSGSKKLDPMPISVADALFFQHGTDAFDVPLWPDDADPLADEWAASAEMRKSHPGWSVFTDLYENALNGRPQNWPLLIELAEKDEDFWTGPDVKVLDGIAEVVEDYERRRLLDETRRLQAKLAALKSMGTTSATTRSHNNPPELIDDDFIAEKVSEIEPDLKAAEEELDTQRPDRARLKAIARRLFAAVSEIIKYCAKVADTSLMSAAKASGTTAGAYGVDLFLNDGRFATYVSDLIRFAFGG